MSTQYDELSPGSPTDVLDHPDHNHSDLQKLAGDVLPMPIQPAYPLTAGPASLPELREGQKQAKEGNSNIVNHPSRDNWSAQIKKRISY